MNTFRSKGVFPGVMVLTSMFMLVLGFRVIRTGVTVSIFYIYSMTVVDVVLLGLILPVIAVLIIKEVNGQMVSSRLLAWNSRLVWWKELKKSLLKICLVYSAVIILPVFILANVFVGRIRTSGEWVYMLFLFLSYFMYFYLLALCILVLEIKFHQSLLAVSFVLLVSFLPNVFAFLFRKSGIPTISGFLDLSYALEGDNFYWYQCERVCVILLILLILIEKAGRVFIKKQDIYWK